MRHSKYFLIAVILGNGIYTCSVAAAAFEDCGDPFANGVGPFDYTSTEDRTAPSKIPIVEEAHFTSSVEALSAGATSENVMHDLDYTLRAIPNHHRALYAMSRHKLTPEGARSGYNTAECYFQRALQFKPNDGVVHMLFGIYLYGSTEMEQALEQLQQAVKIMPTSAEAHYNLGLVSIEVKDYQGARNHAHEAYRLGYPLLGLKEKLQKLGIWEERTSLSEPEQQAHP